MSDLVIPILIAVAIVLPVAVLLARQGFPGSSDDDSGPEEASLEGPTGEEYPPGSRPAGPGAERMTDEPPRPGEGE